MSIVCPFVNPVNAYGMLPAVPAAAMWNCAPLPKKHPVRTKNGRSVFVFVKFIDDEALSAFDIIIDPGDIFTQ